MSKKAESMLKSADLIREFEFCVIGQIKTHNVMKRGREFQFLNFIEDFSDVCIIFCYDLRILQHIIISIINLKQIMLHES